MTYRRTLADIVNVEELERVSSEYLSGQKYYGKQVQVAIDGKVLRGTLDDQQNGTYLLAGYLPQEGSMQKNPNLLHLLLLRLDGDVQLGWIDPAFS